MIIPCEFESVWSGGIIHTPAKLDTTTFRVFDIAQADCDYEHLESESIILNDNGYNVECGSDNEYYITVEDVKHFVQDNPQYYKHITQGV